MHIASKIRIHSLFTVSWVFKKRKTSKKKPGSPSTDEVQDCIAVGWGSLNIMLKNKLCLK